jgi:hypothetical protein
MVEPTVHQGIHFARACRYEPKRCRGVGRGQERDYGTRKTGKAGCVYSATFKNHSYQVSEQAAASSPAVEQVTGSFDMDDGMEMSIPFESALPAIEADTTEASVMHTRQTPPVGAKPASSSIMEQEEQKGKRVVALRGKPTKEAFDTQPTSLGDGLAKSAAAKSAPARSRKGLKGFKTVETAPDATEYPQVDLPVVENNRSKRINKILTDNPAEALAFSNVKSAMVDSTAEIADDVTPQQIAAKTHKSAPSKRGKKTVAGPAVEENPDPQAVDDPPSVKNPRSAQVETMAANDPLTPAEATTGRSTRSKRTAVTQEVASKEGAQSSTTSKSSRFSKASKKIADVSKTDENEAIPVDDGQEVPSKSISPVKKASH